MKANHLVVLLLFLMLGATDAQHSISLPSDTNNSLKFKELLVIAESGNAAAEDVLGGCYAQGASNYVEAVKWYRKAAEPAVLVLVY